MTDDLSFEFSRGGFTWGSALDVDDDDVVAMFMLEGKVLPMVWAEQVFPVVGDIIRPDIIGADGDGSVEVKVRLWQQANLLMIGCVRVANPEEDGQ